jgi:hypothetical protein
LMWLASGVIGLAQPASVTAALLAALGLTGIAASAVAAATCLLDLALGVALLVRGGAGAVALLQLAVVAGYTAGLSLAQPALWVDPFGPLLKNLPIMVAIMVLAAIENDR